MGNFIFYQTELLNHTHQLTTCDDPHNSVLASNMYVGIHTVVNSTPFFTLN